MDTNNNNILEIIKKKIPRKLLLKTEISENKNPTNQYNNYNRYRFNDDGHQLKAKLDGKRKLIRNKNKTPQ